MTSRETGRQRKVQTGRRTFFSSGRVRGRHHRPKQRDAGETSFTPDGEFSRGGERLKDRQELKRAAEEWSPWRRKKKRGRKSRSEAARDESSVNEPQEKGEMTRRIDTEVRARPSYSKSEATARGQQRFEFRKANSISSARPERCMEEEKKKSSPCVHPHSTRQFLNSESSISVSPSRCSARLLKNWRPIWQQRRAWPVGSGRSRPRSKQSWPGGG